MRVLVVDDDDSLRAMVSALLLEIGYELIGFASLDEVADNASFVIAHGDLILVDIAAARAIELRASLATAFPQATVAIVGDGDYESIPKERRRKRTRARTTQRDRERITTL